MIRYTHSRAMDTERTDKGLQLHDAMSHGRHRDVDIRLTRISNANWTSMSRV